MSNNLGRAIQKIRKQQGLSQSDLALKVKLHQVTISRIESGKSLPSMESFRSITEALGVSETQVYLFCLDSRQVPSSKIVDFLRLRKELKELFS